MIEVCFVCLGNICRSPLAQGVFATLVAREGLDHKIQTSSAGVGDWHVGSLPDPRMTATARKRGIEIKSRARQFQASDFQRYDLVLAMDSSNLAALEQICPPALAKDRLMMFRSFDPEGGNSLDVPDPYYGGDKGFDTVFAMVDRTCPKVLQHIRSHFLKNS